MGSWNWLKKNPLQIFSKSGVFHPMKPHRRLRILRRHLTLFDFLHRSLLAHEKWRPKNAGEKDLLAKEAKKIWF
jgi:hypothetical protein